uniref:Uncharacterized protein n=1 Tax=Cannabis sativa TaxID=3483 RepID=A0A803NMP2_CANSA
MASFFNDPKPAYVNVKETVGDVLNPRDNVRAIFKGLPKKYDTFVISTNTKLKQYSIAKIEALLLVSESRIEKSDKDIDLSAHVASMELDPTPEATLANYGRGAYKQPYPGPNYPRMSSNAGHRGNYENVNNSPSFGSGRGNPSPPAGLSRGGRYSTPNNRPQCQIYLKIDHIAQHCYYRFDKTFPSPSFPGSSFIGPSNAAPPQANVVVASNEWGASWYSDSGAINHYTLDASNIHLSTEYSGQEQLFVGDGSSLSIENIGQSLSTLIKLDNLLFLTTCYMFLL